MSEAEIAAKKPCFVELEEGKTYWWCTCGRSTNQPWCDGSHKGTDFQPMELTADETRKRGLCTCKRTANAPFCDGAHKDL